MEGGGHVAVAIEERGGGRLSYGLHNKAGLRPGGGPPTLRMRGSNSGVSKGMPMEPILSVNAIGGAKLHEVPSILDRLRKLADEDRQEFSRLQDDVWESIGEHEVLEASFTRQFEQQRTFGEMAADAVAEVGGSWNFVFAFAIFIVIWTSINLSMSKGWDPYPFILLNLFLSTLAAFQAPVIMMSQNRQSLRDRAQSDYTARVNLRAELATRHINAKLDALISSSWRRLLESQAIQTTLLERVIETQRVLIEQQSGQQQPQQQCTSSTMTGMEESQSTTGNSSGASNYNNKGSMTVETGFNDESSLSASGGGLVTMNQGPSSTPPRLATTTFEGSGSRAVSVYNDLSRVDSSTSTSTARSLSTTPQPLLEHEMMDTFTTPLASLSLAPPAARLVPGLESPWYLETEHDDHLVFLLRVLMRAQLDPDEQLLIFEHRLANFGDNFYGVVSHVRLEASHTSFIGEGLSISVPMREDLRDLRGRALSPTYVSMAVNAASIVDTGGGAEPWMPFAVCYDMEFTEGAVLDSIFAGEGFVSLRNALDMTCMTATGSIKRVVLHPRGCHCSLSRDSRRQHANSFSTVLSSTGSAGYREECPQAIAVENGDLPPRFKPSVSASRQDRIADFWKTPLSRVEVSYDPAPLFACVTLREGQVAWPLEVEFIYHPHVRQAKGLQKGQATTLQANSPSHPHPPPPPFSAGTVPDKPAIVPRRSSFPSIRELTSGSRTEVPIVSPLEEVMEEEEPEPTLPPPLPKLFMIINPSGEALCGAVALGVEGEEQQRDREAEEEREEDDEEASSSGVRRDEPRPEKAVMVGLDATMETLPHNVWLELSVVKEGLGYQVEMPCVLKGPAALFFYSSDGRLRLRGMLRDDGEEGKRRG